MDVVFRPASRVKRPFIEILHRVSPPQTIALGSPLRMPTDSTFTSIFFKNSLERMKRSRFRHSIHFLRRIYTGCFFANLGAWFFFVGLADQYVRNFAASGLWWTLIVPTHFFLTAIPVVLVLAELLLARRKKRNPYLSWSQKHDAELGWSGVLFLLLIFLISIMSSIPTILLSASELDRRRMQSKHARLIAAFTETSKQIDDRVKKRGSSIPTTLGRGRAYLPSSIRGPILVLESFGERVRICPELAQSDRFERADDPREVRSVVYFANTTPGMRSSITIAVAERRSNGKFYWNWSVVRWISSETGSLSRFVGGGARNGPTPYDEIEDWLNVCVK